MPISKAVYGRLRDASSVDALIAGRVYVGAAPTSAIHPYMVVQQVSGSPLYAYVGNSGTARASIQVDAYAQTPAAATAMRDAIKATLEDYRGTMGDDSLFVKRCALREERQSARAPTDASDVWTHRRSLDFVFLYTEN